MSDEIEDAPEPTEADAAAHDPKGDALASADASPEAPDPTTELVLDGD